MKFPKKKNSTPQWTVRVRRWLNRAFGLPDVFPLDSLPDLTLLRVFNFLSLFKLIEFRAVSKRWNVLAASACKTRHRLTLLIGNGAQAPSEAFDHKSTFDTLACYALSEENVHFFHEQLPSINSLVVVIIHPTERQLIQLMDLVLFWAKELVKLSIDVEFHPGTEMLASMIPGAEQQNKAKIRLLSLLIAINSFPSLKQLKIWIDGRLLPMYTVNELDLPILSRLELFDFKSDDEANILDGSLVHFTEDNPHLSSLSIWNAFDKESATNLLELEPHIAQSFHRLNLAKWSKAPKEDLLRRFVVHFANLRSLRIEANGTTIPLPVLAQYLSQLQSLSFLHLYLTDLQSHLAAIEEELFHLEPDQGQVLEALPGVQYFSFALFGCSFTDHEELEELHLHQMLPNVLRMDIDGTRHACDVCGDFGPRRGRLQRPADWRRVEQCLEQMVEPAQEHFAPHALLDVHFDVSIF